jgi:cell division protein FtsN
MTRMADPVRPHDDPEDDEQRFEDEGRRSTFSALWFRAILVVVVLGVVAAVAVPYVLELANQPPPRPGGARSEAPPLPTPVAPPTASPMTPPTPSPAPMERPSAVEKAPTAETPTAMPGPVPPEKSATMEKPATAQKPESTVAREQAAAQVAASTGGESALRGAYFVQVGAFKSQDSAKKLATRLRDLKYNVEESAMTGTKSGRPPAPAPGSGATSTPSDKYDVYVTGATPADINAKLGSKGLTSEPSAGGVIVKPSLPLREAVALSKDLAVDGLKVQVRRASGGAAAPSTAGSGAIGGDAVYRVRVGPFDDRGAATSTLRELEQRGYTPFLARGGQ